MDGVLAQKIKKPDMDMLVRSAGGDTAALAQIYEHYYERIYRFAVLRAFDKTIAEDLTSAIFLTVAGKIGSFKGTTEKEFSSWIYRISANKINSYIRNNSNRERILGQVASSIVKEPDEVNSSERLDWCELYEAISKLKPKHQTIVTLRFFEDMSCEDIAETLGMNASTVRVGLHRCIKQLRNQLRPLFEGVKDE